MKNFLKLQLGLIFKIAILCSGLTFGSVATARGGTAGSGFSAYAAYGVNFTFPGSLRLGWNSWEGGIFEGGLLGFSKNFHLSPLTYSSFGFGISTDSSVKPALRAAVGFNYDLFWKLGLRGEFAANAITSGTTNAHGLIGVSYGF